MNLYTGDIKVIEQEMDYLIENIPKRKNAKTAYSLYVSLVSLFEYYSLLTSDVNKYCRILRKNRQFFQIQNAKENNLYSKAIKNFIKHKYMHQKFIDTILEQCEDIDFIEDDINEPNMKEEDMLIILSNYYKEKNPTNAILLNNLINGKRIYQLENINQEFNGSTIRNLPMNTNHVFIVKQSQFDTLFTLVHEVGHVNDLENESNSKGIYYFINSPFIETIAHLEEKRLMNFLLEEKIERKTTTSKMDDLYQFMLDQITYVFTISKLPDKLIENNKYNKLKPWDLYGKFEDFDDIEDIDFELLSELSLLENMKYGYGSLFGIYFSVLEKENQSKFKETYTRFLNLKHDYMHPDFFSNLGVSQEEIATVVKDEIEATKTKVYTKKS